MFEQAIRRPRHTSKFQTFVATPDPVSSQNLARLGEDFAAGTNAAGMEERLLHACAMRGHRPP